MKEYWKGWKFYKTETPFDILHFYEDDGDADFDRLFSIVDRKHEPNVTYCGLSGGDEVVCLFKKDHEKDHLDRINKGSRPFVAEKKEEYEAGFDLIELTVAVF